MRSRRWSWMWIYPPNGDEYEDEDEDGFAERDEEMDEFADEEEADEDVDIADEWGLTDGESESMSSSDEGVGIGMPGGLRLAGEEGALAPRRGRPSLFQLTQLTLIALLLVFSANSSS